jgi:hypothetical protein
MKSIEPRVSSSDESKVRGSSHPQGEESIAQALRGLHKGFWDLVALSERVAVELPVGSIDRANACALRDRLHSLAPRVTLTVASLAATST